MIELYLDKAFTGLDIYLFAICVINARGDTIIKQIKPILKYKTEDKKLYPLINWKRFFYGLAVGEVLWWPTLSRQKNQRN